MRSTKENIFIELSQHMPPEDYFTTCFGFLLRHDRRLTTFLLERILSREPRTLRAIHRSKLADIEVKIQEAYLVGHRRRKIDVRIAIGNTLHVLVENKLGAQASAAQIRDYLKIAESVRRRQQAREAFVFLITKHALPLALVRQTGKNLNFVHCQWADISGILREYLARRLPVQKAYYVSCFVQFMEGLGILSFKGFSSTDYGSAWSKYSELRDNVRPLLQEIKRRMEKRGFLAWSKEPVERDYSIEFTFRKRSWRWLIGLDIKFDLAPKRGEKIDRVWYTIELWFRKRFRETLREKFKDDTDEAASYLEKDFDVEWDQNSVFRSEELTRLPRKMLDQKQQIFDFVDTGIGMLEKSGLMTLIDKTLKEYK